MMCVSFMAVHPTVLIMSSTRDLLQDLTIIFPFWVIDRTPQEWSTSGADATLDLSHEMNFCSGIGQPELHSWYRYKS